MPDTKDKRIAELEEQLAQALAIIQKLQRQVELLQVEVEELRRAGKRQATPFARREWVERPKKPGRKAGQGKFVHRSLPTIQAVYETKTAQLHGCPECGGKLQEIRKHEQYVTDIPVVEVKTTRFVTFSGYCRVCQRRVRSRHPEQTSPASGAAGVLVEAIRKCSVVYTDETGWRMGTLAAWLWVFTNSEASVYAIRDNRSSDVLVDILGTEFKGILASDGFVAYNQQRLKTWLKQKCVGHLLRELKEMQENQSGRALHFARQVTIVLQDALALKTQKPSLDPFTFIQRAQDLEARLDVLMGPQRRLTDRDNLRFANRLRKHRPHLLRFLYVDSLEATNNQAERMLRPAVITRKTNGCNRTRDGANTHAILSSVLVTARQHSIPILDYLVQLQRFGEKPPPLLSPLDRSVPCPQR